jgi:hypothetical protein
MCKSKIMMLILVTLFLNLSVFVSAEYKKERDLYKDRVFLSVHGGYFFSEEVYSIHTDLVILNQPAWFENSMKFKESFIFGGGIGFFFTENLGLRVDVDICSTDAESKFTANLPNPLNPSQSAEVSTTVTGFASNWTIVHADLIYRQKLTPELMLSLGAGVTGVFTDIYAIDEYTWKWIGGVLGIVDIQFDVYETEAYSFNVLGQLQYYVGDDISLSLEGRYFHSSTDIEVPEIIYTTKLPVYLGGFYLSVGLNLHF